MNQSSTIPTVSTSSDGMTTPPALPPIECVSWCEDQDGHIGAGDPDDQWCSRVTSISS